MIVRYRLARFLSDTRAATAVEFAIVGGLFIFVILFIMCVGVIEFVAQSVDFATQKAARQVMTGVVQTQGMSQSNFQSLVCANLPATIPCSNVIVNLYTVTYGTQPNGYYAFTKGGNASGLLIPPLSSGSAQYSPGVQGNYEYLLVVYPITFFPSVFSSALGLTTYNGAPAYPIVATAAFRNEQY